MHTEHASVIQLTQAKWTETYLWSYVLRDPADQVVVQGEASTLNACQRQAMLLVSNHAEKLRILQAILRCSRLDQGWRFEAIPPSARSGSCQRPRPYRPTSCQIEVLMLGLIHSLSRYSKGWCCDDGLKNGDVVRMFNVGTIAALWRRNLIDANCQNPIAPYEEPLHEYTSEGSSRFQIWTSDLGIQTLQNEGMLIIGGKT